MQIELPDLLAHGQNLNGLGKPKISRRHQTLPPEMATKLKKSTKRSMAHQPSNR
ncbi:hypothetical protein M378DRAFT_828173 [Amanita muscaria Koide BX008]|uniref:Uncharacterized protein n=1 Tax=Amanita muscaria (strain Koide BX008) TaxID=946122 RepID=A0A0C2X3L1_AMAMK|nr:hypothetical protein M378DRAFT_828173 [Amanita muscaria Koide BX008]